MKARIAFPKDEDALFLLAEANMAEFHAHLEFDGLQARALFRRAMATACPTFFVCEDDGDLVGYLLAKTETYAAATGFFASQEVLYVRPDKRGTRAAVRLVKIFNEWSDRIGAVEVFTGIANGFQPERTARFFEHFGFEPVGQYLRRIRNV
jgi:GNAT superfamily N-acetyltransferase